MRYLRELWSGEEEILKGESSFIIPRNRGSDSGNQKKKVELLALGDVGSMLLIGLRTLGEDVCSSIGIHDINDSVTDRYIHEVNQIVKPFDSQGLPPVERADELFHGDVFIFCASRGVPALHEKVADVRMAQLEANVSLIKAYAREAVEKGYQGDFFVVSDPVDPLCKAVLSCGIKASRIRGFGLGVMNGRAAFYDESGVYRKEGRVYGPHGEDLVVANSVYRYNDKVSRELTEKTVTANLKVRELGFKPFIAPAFSSGVFSILETLRGYWHYSSLYLGEAFLGVKNRRTAKGDEVEDLPLDSRLFKRIEKAYDNLKSL